MSNIGESLKQTVSNINDELSKSMKSFETSLSATTNGQPIIAYGLAGFTIAVLGVMLIRSKESEDDTSLMGTFMTKKDELEGESPSPLSPVSPSPDYSSSLNEEMKSPEPYGLPDTSITPTSYQEDLNEPISEEPNPSPELPNSEDTKVPEESNPPSPVAEEPKPPVAEEPNPPIAEEPKPPAAEEPKLGGKKRTSKRISKKKHKKSLKRKSKK